jgi:hypothetical protein
MKKNRKTLSLAIVLLLMCALTFSLASSKKTSNDLFYDVFVPFADELGKASYKEVNSFLSKTSYRIDATKPTSKDFGEIKAYVGNNYVTFQFFPLDNSYDSKDFGNIEKEVVSLLSYNVKNKSITISTGMHTTLPKYTIFEQGKGNAKASGFEALLNYYINSMGGVKRDTQPVKPSVSSDAIVGSVKTSVKKHFNKDISPEVNLYGKNLIIKVGGKDNLTTKLIKGGMHKAIYDVMSENRNPPVDFDFLISFPLIDAKGNSSQEIVMKVTFYSDTMKKINWNEFLHIDIENAADRYWEHPAFSK